MEPLFKPDREYNLTDDIKPRGIEGFDGREGKVRRQSIGWLDDNYISGRVILQPRYFSDAYTRIPPLATLPTLFGGKSLKATFIRRVGWPFVFTGAALIGFYTLLRSKAVLIKEAIWAHLPKSYNLRKGAFIEWSVVRNKAIRIAAPLIVLGLIIAVITVYTSNSPNLRIKPKTGSYSSNRPASPSSSQPSSASPQASSASASSETQPQPSSSISTNSSSSPSNYSAPAASTGSSPSSPSSSSSVGSSNTTSPSLNGGTGGDGTTSSSSSSSGSSSSLLPTTVTVPGINTSLGGKTLIVTSPTSLTLN